MIDLEDIFDKHELELEFKFIDFEHRLTSMFEEFFNQKQNQYGRLHEPNGESLMRDYPRGNGQQPNI